MAKLKLNKKAQKDIRERMKFVSDTALQSTHNSMSRKNIEGLITSLEVNAKIIEADLNNVISYVPDDALAILKENGFECDSPKGHVFRDVYVDFKKYLTEGFGEDGTDRVKTITFNLEDNTWYGSSGHRDLDGNYWYEESMEEGKTIQDALAWVLADRMKAPTQKEAVS